MKQINQEANAFDSSTAGKLERSRVVPQTKICGLTRVDEALACVELGANAIGCVFFPPSPRHLTDERARDISLALPPGVCSVGVFVNEDFSTIMAKVERCRLKAVQLHGREPQELVGALVAEGVTVIKGLFINGFPSVEDADFYGASAYLVECAGGPLPGGNARSWDWEAAAVLCEKHPVILAGGLSPENVSEAIRLASPDAVDVSSGVEREPARKDLGKVKRFLEAVFQSNSSREPKKIFQ